MQGVWVRFPVESLNSNIMIYFILKEYSEDNAIESTTIVEHASTNFEKVSKRFVELEDFCKEAKDSGWYYKFTLIEYGEKTNRQKILKIISNE